MGDQLAAQLHCSLQFDPQPRTALLVRLTPQLRTALADAQATGLPTAIRLSSNGSPNVRAFLFLGIAGAVTVRLPRHLCVHAPQRAWTAVLPQVSARQPAKVAQADDGVFKRSAFCR